MRVCCYGRSRYVERRSVYENGAPAGGVSPRRALSLSRRRFLSENAAAIESRACRVLSSGSRRVSVTRASSLIRHSLAKRYLSAFRPQLVLASLSPAVSLLSPFPFSVCRFRAPLPAFLHLSYHRPPARFIPSPTLSRAVRTANARFDSPQVSRTESRPRILDAASGEPALSDAQVYTDRNACIT